MNKTIQSTSYQGYSKTLLDNWISDFAKRTNKDFLETNLYNCLIEFRDWAGKQVIKANDLASPQKVNLHEKIKDNFQIWLDEKVNKMLDVYWAPLSQAATQYTSSTYKSYFENLINNQDLKSKVDNYLAKINNLTGVSGSDMMTSSDILLFFDELTLIRRTPFTKKAIISIPFRVFESASSSIDEKLAGIAHELGHFVYWRKAPFDQINMILDNDLEEIVSLLKNPPFNYLEDKEIRFIKPWIEELFADLVGAEIAGNVYVNAGKNRVIRGNKSSMSLSDNDQEHVPDILRPLVSIYAVNRDRTKALEEWKAFFETNFLVDMSTTKVKALGEKEGQRDIYRSPEQLTNILMDTIDILSGKLIDKNGRSLIQPDFAAIPDSILAQKAVAIAQKSQSKLTDLDVFLEPLVLESGVESHSHTFKQGHHKHDPYTFTHT